MQGFYKKAELELLIQRRTSRKPLADAAINAEIVERYYQTRAIRRIGEAFERDRERKALVVMATGAGKTRTVIALCDLLMRCNWAKRVLFLADRVALVNQAVNAFKTHLPDALAGQSGHREGHRGPRLRLDLPDDDGADRRDARTGSAASASGTSTSIVIDEAHRSVYQKYRAIFDYFDSLLVGLTATPKDEIDHNTYGLFDLETRRADRRLRAGRGGAGRLPRAAQGRLGAAQVPARGHQLRRPLRGGEGAVGRAGVERGRQHARIASRPRRVNKWLFNKDTVDKVLEHLMTHGQKVAGGDRLGKTIIFAKNQDHAEFIAERFNANYPHYKGAFARVITFRTEYAQSLIDDFSNTDKAPHIAISVDMLDTGIDVPEVVNLVFFKLVRSKTKFWQMIGRGTRLCPDLFGPGKDKEFFYIFDYCQNLEFFSQNPETTDGALGESLGQAAVQGAAGADRRAAIAPAAGER